MLLHELFGSEDLSQLNLFDYQHAHTMLHQIVCNTFGWFQECYIDA